MDNYSSAATTYANTARTRPVGRHLQIAATRAGATMTGTDTVGQEITWKRGGATTTGRIKQTARGIYLTKAGDNYHAVRPRDIQETR